MGQKRNDADRAEPPAPVSGAPMGRGVVVVTDEARGVTGVPPDVPVVIGVVVVVVAAVVAVVTAVVDVVVAGATVVGVVVTTGGGAKRQVGTVIVLSSIVTAPLIARARPFTVAPVFQRDRRRGEDRSGKVAGGPQGGGAANLPEHVARLRPVLEYH